MLNIHNWTSLSSPVNDINEIHKNVLEKLNINLIKLLKPVINATRSEIFKSTYRI